MAAIGLDTRRLDHWTHSLVQAFILSLLFHALLFGTIELGFRFGWWRPESMPRWLAAAMFRDTRRLSSAEELIKHQTLLQQQPQENQETPMVFFQVDPAQATAEAPKQAKYYSARNSIAANPNPTIDTKVPRVDGNQTRIPKTTSVARPTPAQEPPTPPPQTAATPPPKVEPKPAEPSTKPQPEILAALPKTSPPVGETIPEKPSIPAKLELNPGGNMALAPAVAPSLPAAPLAPPHRRPRTVAQAKMERGLLAGEKMRQEGGVGRHAEFSSLDARATPFGAYDEAVVMAIQKRWFDLLDQNDLARGRRGKVVLEFEMVYDGRIANLRVAESNVGDLLSLICERAVEDPAPYERWPSDMRRLVGRDYRLVRFTFYYD